MPRNPQFFGEPKHRNGKRSSGGAHVKVLRVAAYLRVSTDEQARSGLGIEAQRAQVRAMATVKGWPAPIEYVDNGISGTKVLRSREQMRALLATIEAGEIDALIVPALDRLGRTTRIILDGVDFFAEHGVTFVSCRESFDTSTAAGQFVVTIFAALAQMERDTIAGRTKSALAVKQTRDGEVGGKLPYGYLRTEDKRIIVDDVTAGHARRIFALRRQRFTMRAIAAQMNAENIPSPNGATWWASSVREVLRNEAAYKGGKRGGSEVRWPRILKRS